MANSVYKKKMGIEETINDLQIYMELYPHDVYSDAIETALWLLSKNDIGLSEAQELYNEGFQDGYHKGYHERKEQIDDKLSR